MHQLLLLLFSDDHHLFQLSMRAFVAALDRSITSPAVNRRLGRSIDPRMLLFQWIVVSFKNPSFFLKEMSLRRSFVEISRNSEALDAFALPNSSRQEVSQQIRSLSSLHKTTITVQEIQAEDSEQRNDDGASVGASGTKRRKLRMRKQSDGISAATGNGSCTFQGSILQEIISPEDPKTLDASFFLCDSLDLAPRLLGKFLRRDDVILQITEVEAYRPNDTACHARVGITSRTAPMFGPGGHAYVYLCYGMHVMLNIVADRIGVGAAVLIRSCAPIAGLKTIQERRKQNTAKPILLTGPGKVGKALGLTTEWSNHPLYVSGISSWSHSLAPC